MQKQAAMLTHAVPALNCGTISWLEVLRLVYRIHEIVNERCGIGADTAERLAVTSAGTPCHG